MKSAVVILSFVFARIIHFSTAVVPIREFQAVAGGEALLPCNIEIPREREILSLIYWYMESPKSLLYTLDFRKGLPDDAKHFPGKSLIGRARFETNEYPPTLKIKPTFKDDEGVYKCRVEYKRARTVTRLVKLNVVVPPQAAVVMDERGQKLQRLTGPYDEGSQLTLLCEAEGGNPAPVVTWWKSGNLLDDTYFRTSQGHVRNELVIPKLHRADFMVELICQASNTNLTQPLNASVRIDLNMRPLYVRISTPRKPLKTGEELRLECETSGSRPTAKVVWWIDNNIVPNEKQSTYTNRNVTFSSTHLKPSIEDNGKIVYCKADNPALPHSEMQDTWALNVYFSPIVSLQLGSNIKYAAIKEGNDVYLECVIKTNPPVSELIWFFDGVPFFGNSSAGIIISNQSLVLQKVRKEHRGNYKCSAANSEGQGESRQLLLEVRYAPSCKLNQRSLYGVARGEDVNISCEVDADPRDVTFRWALNNSVESVELQNFTSRGARSILTFTPKTMLEFGIILCWSENSVGQQKDPCVSRIIPAGPPDPVRNCYVTNRSQEWLTVSCEPGYNGGLTQRFHLDVYNSAVNHLYTNVSSNEMPTFSVGRLPHSSQFVFVLYSSNEKGKSNSVALLGNTLSLRDSEAEAALMASLSPFLAVLLASLATLLTIGVAALALFQIRKRRRRKVPCSIEEEEKAKVMKQPKKCDEFTESVIGCPDVVPPNNVCDSDSLQSSIIKDGQSPDNAKCSKNYRNCVVALKRSWSLKKQGLENSEVEVSLADLTFKDDITRIPLSPTTIVHHGQWYEADGISATKNVSFVVETNEKSSSHKSMIPSQSTTPF